MLSSIATIFLCQLGGELLAVVLRLPIPGPVLGMAILFTLLVVNKRVPAGVGRVADLLLANISLLFVPASVGIMLHFSRIERDILPIAIVVLGTTLATIAITGLTVRALTRKKP